MFISFLFFSIFMKLYEFCSQFISLLFLIRSVFLFLLLMFLIYVHQIFAIFLCIFSFLGWNFLLVFCCLLNWCFYFLFEFVSSLSIFFLFFSKQLLLICWLFNSKINKFMRFCFILILLLAYSCTYIDLACFLGNSWWKLRSKWNNKYWCSKAKLFVVFCEVINCKRNGWICSLIKLIWLTKYSSCLIYYTISNQ